ncbi:MAG: hypothetical protein EOQ55_13335 [Mesorhizobium sp.]|uniref:hypothetical protein n=1 Tax=unclassified Mesorhizobium TaxID=325217 RepID=UPI000FCB3358|nr:MULTISPECIES: hypothetical protein [unclassified Mesorhizobium]RUV93627.1 hypothetical protein EOA75_13730 [Mesorhizobium sp. M1A.F.Ca.IN.022.07.1.1]RWG19981.1 MAG: hypothetical protein EOQ55_13335 [Mesorhizobium sp.]RWI91277.1 MAG: hypothetical protein EOR21_20605 [Mesorhizobium sp.]TIS66915.1 MAG: hypothetical protein E5X11_08475 [Mesorhizobium sp.]
MQRNETELEMVERHVRLGREHIARQNQIIVHFKDKGYPSEDAEDMLATLLGLQRQHEAHLAYVRKKLGLPVSD